MIRKETVPGAYIHGRNDGYYGHGHGGISDAKYGHDILMFGLGIGLMFVTILLICCILFIVISVFVMISSRMRKSVNITTGEEHEMECFMSDQYNRNVPQLQDNV